MLPRLLLLGTGPTNLLLLRELARRPAPQRETVVVADSPVAVSPGMLTGLLTGRYRREESVVDLAALALSAGAQLVVASLASINARERTVRLEDGRTQLYNAASVAFGRHPAGSEIPGATSRARFLHSPDQVASIATELVRIAREVPEQTPRVIVVGDGTATFEVALALRRILDQVEPAQGVVTIVSSAHVLWTRRGAAARLAHRALEREDVSAILGATVSEVGERQVTLSNGARVPFDYLVWATGAGAPGFSRASLQTDRDGRIVVDAFLQSVSAPGLFASGASASLADPGDQGEGPARAAHQARVLRDNLLSVLAGKPPSAPYRLAARSLVLTETGGSSAIISSGVMAAEGRWVMRLKERRERTLHRRLTGMPPAVHPGKS